MKKRDPRFEVKVLIERIRLEEEMKAVPPDQREAWLKSKIKEATKAHRKSASDLKRFKMENPRAAKILKEFEDFL